jgi:glutaconate CoA-transferase subunit A
MRAASFGIPFQPLPAAALEGSDIPAAAGFRKVVDPWTGQSLWAVPRIAPDWFLTHVNAADEYGNARVEGNPGYDGLMSRASRRIVLTAEEILPTAAFEADPERTLIPHFLVTAVVHVPRGAWPTSCYPAYDVDDPAVRRYLELSRTPEGLARHLEETAAGDRGAVPVGTAG